MSHATSPVSLSSAATHRLPRWILLALCLIYGLLGLFGRDPWKNNDAVGFGIMWTMVNGTLNDWLMPNIAGRLFDHDGPLMFWFGATMIRLFGTELGAPNAARLATACCFFLTCALLWRSTYLLGRRPEVQPYPFAFGGHPLSHDYGRTLADSALLIFLACIGLAQRSHETTAGLAQMALVTLLLYGAVRSLDKPKQGIICCALALGGLTLASGPTLTITLLFMMILSSLICPAFSGWHLATRALPFAFVIIAIWPLSLYLLVESKPHAWQHLQAWFNYDQQRFYGPTKQALGYTLRNLLPFAWPLWPLAIWAGISWRQSLRAPHIVLPLFLTIGVLLLIALQTTGDDILFLLLAPPLAALAAFSLPTLKRSVGNAIDWFALMAATLLTGFIWLVWNAQITGIPSQTARNFYRLLPGFSATFQWEDLLSAAAVTIAWLVIVRWRLHHAPKVIWRSVIIPAAGTTIVWTLMMTLWLPAINYAKTYKNVAIAIANAVPHNYRCIQSSRVGEPQLASFAYFTRLRFSDTQPCDLLLDHEGNKNTRPSLKNDQLCNSCIDNATISPQKWRLIWEGHRPADRDENFRLYIARQSTH